MITPLVFLVVGLAFVISLFKGIFQLLGYDFGKAGLNGKAIFNIFKTPFLCFLFMFIYIIWIMPYVEANGY